MNEFKKQAFSYSPGLMKLLKKLKATPEQIKSLAATTASQAGGSIKRIARRVVKNYPETAMGVAAGVGVMSIFGGSKKEAELTKEAISLEKILSAYDKRLKLIKGLKGSSAASPLIDHTINQTQHISKMLDERPGEWGSAKAILAQGRKNDAIKVLSGAGTSGKKGKGIFADKKKFFTTNKKLVGAGIGIGTVGTLTVGSGLSNKREREHYGMP